LKNLNEKAKLILEQLIQRKQTHPDDHMLHRGTPYTPDELIKEIKLGTKTGKTVVEDLTRDMWSDLLKDSRISGWFSLAITRKE